MATHINPAIKEGARTRIQTQGPEEELGFRGTLTGVSTLNEAKVFPDEKKSLVARGMLHTGLICR